MRCPFPQKMRRSEYSMYASVCIWNVVASRRFCDVSEGKRDRSNLPERPGGCFAQIGPVPFSPFSCRKPLVMTTATRAATRLRSGKLGDEHFLGGPPSECANHGARRAKNIVIGAYRGLTSNSLRSVASLASRTFTITTSVAAPYFLSALKSSTPLGTVTRS